jgi:hypothetical protein
MKKSIKTLLLCVVSCVISSSVFAETQAFQASLVPSIALHERTQRIEGVTLSIWGENPQKSLALGFVNGTSGDSIGCSLAFFANYADRYQGAQFGMVNANNDLYGVQFGFFNYTKTAKTGVQIGFINVVSQNKTWFSNFPNEIAPVMIFINWRLVD